MKNGEYILTYQDEDANERPVKIKIEFDFEGPEFGAFENIDETITILAVSIDGTLLDIFNFDPDARHEYERKVLERSDEWEEVEACEA